MEISRKGALDLARRNPLQNDFDRSFFLTAHAFKTYDQNLCIAYKLKMSNIKVNNLG